jgi:hypothetical protein
MGGEDTENDTETGNFDEGLGHRRMRSSNL